MKLLGITGRKGHGKDTLADVIESQYVTVRRAFADPLKRAAKEVFLLTDEQMTDRRLKETEIPFWQASPREIMQQFGTEAVRDVMGDDVWVKRAELELEAILADQAGQPIPADVVIFTDVRFPNEAEFIHRNGGLVIDVYRPNQTAGDKHISEQPLPRAMVDSHVLNDKNLDGFKQDVLKHYLKHWMEISGDIRSSKHRRVA